MKKIFIILFILLILCSCANKKEVQDNIKDNKENNIVLGSWNLNDNFNDLIIDKEELISFITSSDLNGYDDYKPVALLATQVVAGINYMFLVKNAYDYEILIIYADLDDNLSITKIMPFNLEKYLVNNEPSNSEQLMGGWYAYFNDENVLKVDDIDIFNPKVVEDNFDVYYKPVALLASQMVSGTNYCYLAYEGNVLTNANEQMVIISIYKDLNDNYSINTINYLDFKEIANIADPIPVTCN